jgi:hypothetical protein
MRVNVVGDAVRCPAGVSYAHARSRHRFQRYPGKVVHPPSDFLNENVMVGYQCDPGRIVTAVFESVQSINQDIGCIAIADVAYDPAHIWELY